MSEACREAQTHTTWLVRSQTEIIEDRLTAWSGKSRVYDYNQLEQLDTLLTKYSVTTLHLRNK